MAFLTFDLPRQLACFCAPQLQAHGIQLAIYLFQLVLDPVERRGDDGATGWVSWVQYWHGEVGRVSIRRSR